MAAPTIPGYERLTQIGKGGFSRVYRGEQAKLKRGVAIKVLNFGLNDEADRRSFERECELMGRVSTHPNIVTVHDTAFTEEGQPCIVMEHYPGGSLADLISEVRTLNIKEVLEVGVAIAAALEASHQAGVLHCDLKPQNILISEFGQPALGDFGISTFSEERTRTGGDAGAGFTLAYASPEIVEGASPSVESDVYSLAATLYTSLAGRRPFYYLGPDGAKPTAADQARRILLEEPSSLTEAGVPVEVDAVIRGAMAKDPSARPSSAVDFARALYQVGQQLGLGISPPRIADQGALPVRDPRTDYDEPSLPPTATAAAPPVAAAPSAAISPTATPEVPNPVAPLASLVDDATEARSAAMAATVAVLPTGLPTGDDATALRVDLDKTAVVEPLPPERSKRRSLAPLIGLLSLLVVAGVLFAVTRGGTKQAAVVPPTPETRTPQAILLAPPPPQDVLVSRVGADSVVVSWSNEPADDVTYEIRRDDRSGGPEAVQSPVVIEGIDPNDITCFELTAVRGNRLMPAADRLCTEARGDIYVEASPMVCEDTCQVSLELTGFEPDQLVAVRAIDAATGQPITAEFIDELRTSEAGEALDWEVLVDESSLPGIYLFELTPQGSAEIYRAALVVSSNND